MKHLRLTIVYSTVLYSGHWLNKPRERAETDREKLFVCVPGLRRIRVDLARVENYVRKIIKERGVIVACRKWGKTKKLFGPYQEQGGTGMGFSENRDNLEKVASGIQSGQAHWFNRNCQLRSRFFIWRTGDWLKDLVGLIALHHLAKLKNLPGMWQFPTGSLTSRCVQASCMRTRVRLEHVSPSLLCDRFFFFWERGRMKTKKSWVTETWRANAYCESSFLHN